MAISLIAVIEFPNNKVRVAVANEKYPFPFSAVRKSVAFCIYLDLIAGQDYIKMVQKSYPKIESDAFLASMEMDSLQDINFVGMLNGFQDGVFIRS